MDITHLPIKVLQKLKLLRFLNFQIQALYSDRKYNIPIMNNVGIRNLYYNTEPWLKELIAQILKVKKGIFLDIGANIGQTLMKVRSISSLTYIGMEPNPECVVYLEKLIEVNQLKDCTICPVSLSNRNGLVTLYSNFAASPYASVIDGFRDHIKWNLNQKHIVPVMRCDDIIPGTFQTDDIAIIKIDVEGGELEVIEGMERTLKDYRPYVISEILPFISSDKSSTALRKERQDRLVTLLSKYDYSFFRVDELKKSYELISHLELGKQNAYNYVLAPKEREKEFLQVIR